MRALVSDEDWEARARLSQQLYPQTSEEAFMTFARAKNAQERKLVDAGRGQRFGAFVERRARLDGRLLRDRGRCRPLPERRDPPRPPAQGTGRGGHPRCRSARPATISASSTLVIVADTDGEAIGLYRSLGFADSERQLIMERRSGEWAAMNES